MDLEVEYTYSHLLPRVDRRNGDLRLHSKMQSGCRNRVCDERAIDQQVVEDQRLESDGLERVGLPFCSWAQDCMYLSLVVQDDIGVEEGIRRGTEEG